MNFILTLLDNKKKRELIDAMISSGISQEYITELWLMSLKEVKSEYRKFISLMKH